MTKYEWRKAEKELYLPKQLSVVDVPTSNYLTLEGTGNPNDPVFGDQIQALYPIAYALRMGYKKGLYGDPFEFTVYPLEGVWTTSDGSRGDQLNKDALMYKLMIRQPNQVTSNQFSDALAATRKKKDVPFLDQVQFETYTEGLSLQMIHVGSFDTEGETFAKMQAYLAEHNLTKTTTMGDYQHREIYLSDFRRVAPEKRKTLLRYRLVPSAD